MIKSIYLENWKTHYKSNFDFLKGTNVIIGPMGSGKSSLMDAISFALYGTFPSLAARRVTLEETIMSRPIKQEKSTVRMEFDYNGKEYSVERVVRRSALNEGTLKENGKLIAGPKTTDVTKKLTEILEASYDLFSRAIYSEQNQIDFFLKLSPSQRKEKFDELLGLDRYERARTNSVTLANRIKKMDEDRRNFLSEQKKNLKSGQVTEYEKRIAEKKHEIEVKTQSIHSFEKEIKEKEEKMEKGALQEKELRTLRENSIKAKAKIDSLQDEIKRTRERIGKTDLAKLKENISKNEIKLREISSEKTRLEKELTETEKEFTKCREERAIRKNLLESNLKTLSGYKSLSAECPVCKKPLSAHDKEKLEKELAEKNTEINAEMEKIAGKVEMYTEKLENIKMKSREKDKEKEIVSKENSELERCEDNAAELEKKLVNLNELEKTLGETNAKMNAIKFNEKEFESLRKEFYSLREQLAKTKAESSSAKEMLKELEEAVKRIEQTEKDLKELEKQIKQNEKVVERLAIFTSALKATQTELRTEMLETVNSAMEDVWQRIYPYGDISSVKMVSQENSYEIMARQQNGEWVRVEGILSGGERSSVALTLRIAISLVLTQNLGWIILDEPTHNLDVNSVKQLSETMATHLPEFITQIFIITHDKEMENAATGKLYALAREKEKDGVTKIVSI